MALMAKEAGYEVAGSDLQAGAILPELEQAGIAVTLGPQDDVALQNSGAEWFVHTSALTEDSPELKTARELGLRVSKRDELIAHLIEEKGLKLVAVAGTHGKTTTTSMIIWACKKLNIPVSYLVGTTLGFAKSGHFAKESQYFIYEADEYDRNFLHFHPWLALITYISYDHPDIYPTPEAYQSAFQAFIAQSANVYYSKDAAASQGLSVAPTAISEESFTLSGGLRRQDASLAAAAIKKMAPEKEDAEIIAALNHFPGVGRRFECLSRGVYSDYAHHPEEVAKTLQMAQEEAKNQGYKGVIAVYEPHQNVRQHRIKEGYAKAFQGLSGLFWLPTYLTREDPALAVITPEEFIASLSGNSADGRPLSEVAEPAKPDGALAQRLKALREEGYLILLMSAGPADTWLRTFFKEEKNHG